MTTSRKIFLAAILSSFALANTACSGTAPTDPDTVVISSAGTIQGLTPTAPVASTSPQQITVTGTNFSSGTTLILRSPDGSPTLYTSSTFSDFRPTSISVSVMLATTGNWTAYVRGTDGTDSAALGFTVVGDAGTTLAPQITSISPGTASLSLGSQTINVNGTNFDSGAALTVVSPTGATTTYSSLSGLSSTSFSVQISFSKAGTYNLYVVNGNGLQSSSAQLFVQ